MAVRQSAVQARTPCPQHVAKPASAGKLKRWKMSNSSVPKGPMISPAFERWVQYKAASPEGTVRRIERPLSVRLRISGPLGTCHPIQNLALKLRATS